MDRWELTAAAGDLPAVSVKGCGLHHGTSNVDAKEDWVIGSTGCHQATGSIRRILRVAAWNSSALFNISFVVAAWIKASIAAARVA